MADDNERPTRPPFQSALSEGHQRFLAHVVEHGLACGRRSPDDFIRHFTPHTIMMGLQDEPALRASIIVPTTGLKQKIALKKKWDDATVDLQVALDEGETDAATIVTLFSPDDRVRFLEAQQLWSFVKEGDFWKATSASKASLDIARSHIAFMLERALEDKLLTHRDIVEGITVEELASRLPKAELGRLIMQALQSGERGGSFTDSDLIGTTPPRTLVQYVPLAHIWEAVIVPKIAERHGYQQPLAIPLVEETTARLEPEPPTSPHLPLVTAFPEASKAIADANARVADQVAQVAQAGKEVPAPPSASGILSAAKLGKDGAAAKLKQPDLAALKGKPANDMFADAEEVVIVDEDLKDLKTG